MRRFFSLDVIVAAFSLMLVHCQSGPSSGAQSANDASVVAVAFSPSPQPVTEQPVPVLPIGSSAPDFNLPGTDGKFYQLSDFSVAKVLVIIFSCNHCPTAQAYEDRMIAITNDYKEKKVAVVAISPNSPLGLLYEELGYTDLNDDYEAMIERANYKKYNFPYLYDGDTEAASIQYGPVATPHVFVFDAERKLRYQGRLDAHEKPGAANAEDVRQAIDELLAGKPVTAPETKTFGCTTKWAWKTEYKVKVEKDWSAKPVSVSKLDVAGVQALVKNAGNKKLRLINVWATWCGPCIIEYPEFIALQRMYGARDFEFVSLSADKPEQEGKVLEFLQKKSSAVPNYLFGLDDKYALIEAVDKDWNGALPYTLLVEPGGKVVWKHQGEVKFLDLKRAIVEHPLIGRYY